VHGIEVREVPCGADTAGAQWCPGAKHLKLASAIQPVNYERDLESNLEASRKTMTQGRRIWMRVQRQMPEVDMVASTIGLLSRSVAECSPAG
jgi:hypothetical protein